MSLAIDFTLANVSATLFEGINFFGLLAVPLFILTGDLLNASGVARRLTEFAYAALGWMRGGLGLAAIGASGLFSAISGSNPATTATIGSIMYSEMKRGGYSTTLAVCMMIVLVVGFFLESMPVTIILAPILAPAAIAVGVDPVHFAVIFVMAAAIGFVTPPFGLNLFVASSITGLPYLGLIPSVFPYFLALVAAWILVICVPPMTLVFLPYMGH